MKKLRPWKSLSLIGLSLTGLGLGWSFSRQSLFSLSDFNLLSEHSEDRVREIKKILLPSMGENLFSVSLYQLQREMQLLPWVESVALRRKWPSTLVIDIQEKTPLFLMFFQHKLWGLDHLCRPVARVLGPVNLPQLIVDGNYSLESAQRALGTERFKRICEGMFELSSLQSSSLDFSSADQIRWEQQRGLVVHLGEKDLEMDLGWDSFADAWRRADVAYAYMWKQGKVLMALDASYKNRVVGRLQKFTDGLNLNELVRRKIGSGAATNL